MTRMTNLLRRASYQLVGTLDSCVCRIECCGVSLPRISSDEPTRWTGACRFASSVKTTIYIAPWKVFLRCGITRLPFGRVLTISVAIAVAVRQSSATISLRVSLFLFEISSVPTLREQNQLVIGNGLNLIADRLCK